MNFSLCLISLPFNQSWLFVGISHPDPGDKKSQGYPEGKKSQIPGIKIPRLEKSPIPGIFSKSRKNPDDQKKRYFILRYFKFPIPGISGFSGFFDLAQNKKSQSRGFGNSESGIPKIPSRSQLCVH